MPSLVHLIMGIKNIFIAKGIISNLFYDTGEKKNFLLFRSVIDIIFSLSFLMGILIIEIANSRMLTIVHFFEICSFSVSLTET